MLFEIVPTILTANIDDFSQKIRRVKDICTRVQIDVIDGKFAPNKTVDLGGLRELGGVGELKVDLHLMAEEPLGWISRCLEIIPDRIIGHVEKMIDPAVFVNEVIESGVEAGLALDLATPIESVREDVLLLADLVVILGVKAGIGGQEFHLETLEKIKKVRNVLGEVGKIGVDGGISKENILYCKDAGANIFYVGKSFWEAPNQNGSGQAEDLEKRYNELLEVISN